MIKRIVLVSLCLMLVFSISVLATDTLDDNVAQSSQGTEEILKPQNRFQGGGRENMGMPPDMTNREAMGELSGKMPPDMEIQEEGEQAPKSEILEFVKEYSTPIISVVLLSFAFVFVIFYKRKSY